jgi:DNA helicase HerA-like ATPase
MPKPICIAKADNFCYILPKMADRHCLIAGVTGTGKAVTLQSMAEGFSELGVSVI